jgi:hypothetical protein
MKVGIMKNTLCINAAVFETIETARKFLADGVWTDADDVQELPEGFGIGDSFIDGAWVKAPEPEVEPILVDDDIITMEQFIQVVFGTQEDEVNV